MNVRWRLRWIIIAIVVEFLGGCMSTMVIERVSEREEPSQVGKDFILTADEKAYTISRWWGKEHESLTIPRSDLPAGCQTASFFLNDLSHPLRIAEPVNSGWVTGDQPPLPDDTYPQCGLLVSYGAFSGPPALEGVAVTSAAGLIAKDERIEPQPAAWALLPVAAVVEGYAIVGAIWTLPVWAPVAYLSADAREKRKERERTVLSPSVAACWTAIDDEMQKGGLAGPDSKFVELDWSSAIDNAFDLASVNEPFSDDRPVPVDTRVVLHKGRVRVHSLWTEADVECGLQSGSVVAIRVAPLM